MKYLHGLFKKLMKFQQSIIHTTLSVYSYPSLIIYYIYKIINILNKQCNYYDNQQYTAFKSSAIFLTDLNIYNRHGNNREIRNKCALYT